MTPMHMIQAGELDETCLGLHARITRFDSTVEGGISDIHKLRSLDITDRMAIYLGGARYLLRADDVIEIETSPTEREALEDDGQAVPGHVVVKVGHISGHGITWLIVALWLGLAVYYGVTAETWPQIFAALAGAVSGSLLMLRITWVASRVTRWVW